MPTRKEGPRPSRRLEVPVSAASRAEEVEPVEETPAAEPEVVRESLRNARFPLGVDLWPIDVEMDGPSGWYERDVTGDLDEMQRAGISIVRLYASWRVMEPQVGHYDEDAFDRLAELVDAVGERGMRAIVVLFSAEPFAETTSVPWGARRDPRADSYLLEREADFAARVATRLRHQTSLFGYQLADEAFCVGFASGEEAVAWGGRLRMAVRDADTERPVAIGCDAEVLARAVRIDARAAIDAQEFALSHATASYLSYAAPGPISGRTRTRLRGFLTQLARRGAPVLADGAGVLSLDSSPAEEAAALRLDIATSLVNGGAGVILRRWRDATIEHREPYRVDEHETLVGVTDPDGRPKASYSALVEQAGKIAALDLADLEPLPERFAVIVPVGRFDPLPALGSVFDPRSSFAAWRAAREAQVPTTVICEDEPYEPFAALAVSAPVRLADSTWERLSRYVAGGGTVVCSYGGGDAHRSWRELFGVEFLGDAGPRSRLEVRVAQPDLLGDLRSTDVPLEIPAFALLSPAGATVVATDAKGSPLVTVHQSGQGRAVFVASPVERAARGADSGAVHSDVEEFLRAVLGSAARAAGCAAPLEADDPDVELGVFQGAEADLMIAVNHSAMKKTARVASGRPVLRVCDASDGEWIEIGASAFGVPLPPHGVAMIRVAYS